MNFHLISKVVFGISVYKAIGRRCRDHLFMKDPDALSASGLWQSIPAERIF
jgi:hypothetical protein